MGDFAGLRCIGDNDGFACWTAIEDKDVKEALKRRTEERRKESDAELSASMEAEKSKAELLVSREKAKKSKEEAEKSKEEAVKSKEEAEKSKEEAVKSNEEAVKSKEEAVKSKEELARTIG